MIFKLIGVLIFSFLVAHFIGRRRLIGFRWSFLFSLVLSPIGGLIISLNSRKNDGYTKIQPSMKKRRWGYALLVLGGLTILKIINDFINGKTPDFPDFQFLFIVSVWGGFLLERSRGI